MVQTPDGPRSSTYEALPRHARRRVLVRSFLRSLLVAAAVLVLYFTLPFDNASAANSGLALAVGLIAIGVLLVWQARTVAHVAPYPLIRAIEAVSTTFPLFLVLFATTYFLMDEHVTGSFTQAMTRVDALYFTVTVFSTVGFGDITAISQTARILVIVQMLADLVLLGVVVRVFIWSVQAGLARRDATGGPADS